jgi:hypothetical protein
VLDVDFQLVYYKWLIDELANSLFIFERNCVINDVITIISNGSITNYKINKSNKIIDLKNTKVLFNKCNYFELTFEHNYSVIDDEELLISQTQYKKILSNMISYYENLSTQFNINEYLFKIKHHSSYLENIEKDTTIIDIYIQPVIGIENNSDIFTLMSSETLALLSLLSDGLLQSYAYK